MKRLRFEIPLLLVIAALAACSLWPSSSVGEAPSLLVRETPAPKATETSSPLGLKTSPGGELSQIHRETWSLPTVPATPPEVPLETLSDMPDLEEVLHLALNPKPPYRGNKWPAWEENLRQHSSGIDAWRFGHFAKAEKHLLLATLESAKIDPALTFEYNAPKSYTIRASDLDDDLGALDSLYEEMGRTRDEEAVLKARVRLLENGAGQVSSPIYGLLKLYKREGNAAGVDACYQRLVELMRGEYPSEYQVRTLKAYARFKRDQGRHDSADQLEARAAQIRLKIR